MFALESAMDELAVALGMDPVELRIRNEPERDPERDLPWSSRTWCECLRTGAERFGWAGRDLRPRRAREGRWLIGTGVAAATYPTRRRAAQCRISVRRARALHGARSTRSDIGTGAWTALTQIAADALGDAPRTRRAADRRQQPADGRRRRGLDRDWRRGGRRSCSPPATCGAAGREYGGQLPAGGVTVDGGMDGESRTRRRTRCTRSARTSSRCGWTRTPARCGCRGDQRVRRRGDREPEDGAVPVPGRLTHGPRRWRCTRRSVRRAVRPLRQPRPRRVPRRRPTPTSARSTSPGSTRTTRWSMRWASRASARSASPGRGRRRQCLLARDRPADPGPADHPGQVLPRAGARVGHGSRWRSRVSPMSRMCSTCCGGELVEQVACARSRRGPARRPRGRRSPRR